MLKKYKNLNVLKLLNDFDLGLEYSEKNENFANLFYIYHTTQTKKLKDSLTDGYDRFVDKLVTGFATNGIFYGDFIVQEPKLLRHFILKAINNDTLDFGMFFLKLFKVLKRNHVVIDAEELQDILAKVARSGNAKEQFDYAVLSYLEEVYGTASINVDKIIRQAINSGRNVEKAIRIKIVSPIDRPFSNIINEDNQRKVIDGLIKGKSIIVDIEKLLYILEDSIDVNEIDYNYILLNLQYLSHLNAVADFVRDHNVEISLEQYQQSTSIKERVFYCLVKENVEKSYIANLIFDILQDGIPQYKGWAEEQAKDCKEELLKLVHKSENLVNSLYVLESFDVEEQLKFLQKAVKGIETVEDYSLIEGRLETLYNDVLSKSSLLNETYDKTIKRATNIKCIAELYNLLKQTACEKNIITIKENEFQNKKLR